MVAIVLIAFTVAHAAGGRSSGKAARGVSPGAPAPPFAAPLALSSLEGDVNVAVRRGEGDAGAVPACSVRGADVLNVCALWQRRPVVLAFFAARGAQCVRQLDTFGAVAARHPDIAFAAVSIRGDRPDLRRTIRGRGWRFPVGYDADGILAGAYGVAACPQMTFVRKGGRVLGTSLGEIGFASLDARVARLDG